MKAPSKNISQSIAAQSAFGRNPRPIETGTTKGSLSMTVPGEGGVVAPPGTRDPRSAARFADAMQAQTGK